jgi:ABC-2 type transport system permease protein
VTAVSSVPANPSALTQWWVLTARFIKPTLRNGELALTIASSVVFTAGFYVPLNHIMATATRAMSSSYAQYIMPLVALQAIVFAAISTAFRAAIDSRQGINRRFGTMPMAPLTPVAARIAAATYRCSVALTVSIICGHVIGFRFHRGAVYIVGFCALVIAIGVLLSFAADLVGTGSRNPEAMMPLLILPPLIFGLLSVGVQPVEQFPHWIQPVIRNQPISQFVIALRALAGDTLPTAGSVTWPVLAPTLAWLVGLALLLVPTSALVLSRRSS